MANRLWVRLTYDAHCYGNVVLSDRYRQLGRPRQLRRDSQYFAAQVVGFTPASGAGVLTSGLEIFSR